MERYSEYWELNNNTCESCSRDLWDTRAYWDTKDRVPYCGKCVPRCSCCGEPMEPELLENGECPWCREVEAYV